MKTPHSRCRFGAGFIITLAVGVSAPAQTAVTSASSTPQEAEPAWQQVATQFGPAASPSVAPLARADLARTFYTRFPESPQASTARKLEVAALFGALGSGDPTVESRFLAAATVVRADEAVSEADRAEVSGYLYFHQAVTGAKRATDLPAQMEAAARRLMEEFPSQPQGYESLLGVSGLYPDAKAILLIRELVDSPAPDPVKSSARRRLIHLQLPGRRLADVLKGTECAAWLARLDRPVVIYVWAQWNPSSLALARSLNDRKLGGALWIGVSLDQAPQAATAASVAAEGGFPGRQIVEGAGGVVAERLGLDRAPIVIIADARGVIRDVHAVDSLNAKLANLGL